MWLVIGVIIIKLKGKKTVTNNIVMLYVMNLTQLVLPLLTFPYLTRVLSVSNYGVLSYVKSLMTYTIIIIEFGYLLSGTKDIVEAKEDPQKIGLILGRITVAKILLAFIAFIVLLIMIIFVPLLHQHITFTILSFFSPFLTIFLFDYLFRGLERMYLITYRYLIMKGISTSCIFMFIHNNSQMLLIPLFDTLGTTMSIIWVFHEVKKMGIKLRFDSFKAVLYSIRESFTYFISDIVSTIFNALNTLLIGIYLDSSSVAYWGVIMTLITAVQSMYTPISDGIYPHMLQTKSLKLLRKIIIIFTPLLALGGSVTFSGSKVIMLLIGGQKYLVASPYLRMCVPLLIFSFFSMLFGWPTLGAIRKVRETTFTSILAACVQVVGLIFISILNCFNIPSIIILRTVTEGTITFSRLLLVYKFKSLFDK